MYIPELTKEEVLRAIRSMQTVSPAPGFAEPEQIAADESGLAKLRSALESEREPDNVLSPAEASTIARAYNTGERSALDDSAPIIHRLEAFVVRNLPAREETA